jgi:hypothetical protein
MKPDSMLVEPEYLATARQDVATAGVGQALAAVGQAEPALASFVHESLTAAAGRLALAGAPTEVVQGVHEEVLAIVLTSVNALRRSHYELWKDTATGTRLAQLDPTLKPKHKPRRKKSDDGAAEQQPA